jgi:F-type H+-transporting ATPase subunit gamma
LDSTRDIKRRIASVHQTQKVTKAMKMVAAAKLRRNQQRVLAARPYITKIDQVVYSICSYYRKEGHPLLREPEGGKTAILLVTADRGLCGGYNTNIIKTAMKFAQEKGGADFFTLGRKGREAVVRAGGAIIKGYMLRFDYPKYETAQRISADLQECFLEKGYDEVYIAYQRFASVISQVPTMLRLLPVDPAELEVENLEQVEYIYEPDREGFLAKLLPRYVDNYVYEILLETKASEFGAKMTAMTAATENAGEMIDDLTLTFNQARQSAITREISEVVSGADALK